MIRQPETQRTGLNRERNSKIFPTTGSAPYAEQAKICSNPLDARRCGTGPESLPSRQGFPDFAIYFPGLIMSISGFPLTSLMRQTRPHSPHSLTGDSSAEKPSEWISISTDVLLPQFGHFIAFSPFSGAGAVSPGRPAAPPHCTIITGTRQKSGDAQALNQVQQGKSRSRRGTHRGRPAAYHPCERSGRFSP